MAWSCVDTDGVCHRDDRICRFCRCYDDRGGDCDLHRLRVVLVHDSAVTSRKAVFAVCCTTDRRSAVSLAPRPSAS